MKIDNKGFAVSTILYGILSLTILILMIIFGVMKSSKEMNEDLVESLEETMNTCVLLETKVEDCYLSGMNNCNDIVNLYNNCFETKTYIFDLYDVVEVGDYVNYDAGNWLSVVEIPDEGNVLMFGGYNSGQSKNTSSNCMSREQYDGWRVFSKKDNQITLIHAGISECFYVDFGVDNDLIYNYQSIMGKEVTGILDEDYNYVSKNFNDDYLNIQYAVKAYMLDSANVYGWSSTNSQDYSTNDLINIGTNYLLIDETEGNPSTVKYMSEEGTILETSKGLYGIRPLVELIQNIQTKGFYINDYGEKEWILIN